MITKRNLNCIKINLDVFDPVERDRVHGKTIVKVYLDANLKLLRLLDSFRFDPDMRVPYVEVCEENGETWINNGIVFPIGYDEEEVLPLDKEEEALVIGRLMKESAGKLKEDLISGLSVIPREPEKYVKTLVGLPGIEKELKITADGRNPGVKISVVGTDGNYGGIVVKEHEQGVRAVIYDYQHDEPIMEVNLC